MAFKIPAWLVQAMVTFVVRQLAKFFESSNFDKIREDLEIRLRDLIPGEMFDDAAIKMMDVILDTIQKFLQEPMEAKNIFEHLKSGDVNYAIESLLTVVKAK